MGLLWRRCDRLCISGFVDDFVYSRLPVISQAKAMQVERNSEIRMTYQGSSIDLTLILKSA